MAETDLMARLERCVGEWLVEGGASPADKMASELVARLLRTLAAVPEEGVIAEAAEAGANALLQDMAESLRLTLQERVAIALRAASPLLLARQAGEMERMRTELQFARDRADAAEERAFEYAARSDESRRQLRAAEQRNGTLLALIRNDAFAITFQTLGQYRSALMAFAVEQATALARPASPADEEGRKR